MEVISRADRRLVTIYSKLYCGATGVNSMKNVLRYEVPVAFLLALARRLGLASGWRGLRDARRESRAPSVEAGTPRVMGNRALERINL
jgi:hypothetical protein